MVLGAFLLALAFPRTDWDGTAWLALVPMLVVAIGGPVRSALAWGWLFGTVFFLVLLRWLTFTFGLYSAIPWPLTWLPTLALAAYCGLFPAAVAAAVAFLAGRRSVTAALLATPFLWVAAEWLRGQLLGGFPWGALGYSQYQRLAVIQIAELGGVHAVSFLLAAVNAAAAGCLVLGWRAATLGAVAAAALLAGSLAFGATRLAEPLRPAEATVAVMQPSIEQPLKFDPDHAATTLGIYLALTRRAAAERPDLVVWPETATPSVLRRDPELLATLTGIAGAAGTHLLVGSIDVEDGRRPRLTNTAFLLGAGGVVGRYDKMQLVPFGEYVPLSGLIGFVRSWAEFIADLEPGSRPVVFPGPPAPFGVVICYEGIFPDLFRRFVRGGARLMVNMTNDAWFGRTSGPPQHLAMYPLRAVEHRVAVVRAANTGVSAFVAPTGKIWRRLNLYDRGTMTEAVPLRVGQTVYGRLGDWLPWLSVAVSGLVLAAAARWRRSERAR